MTPRRQALAALAAYLMATLLFTWPLASHVRSRFPAASHPSAYNDILLLSWILSWDVHQLLREPLHLFDANISHPLRHTLGYSEALVSEALLLLPLAPLTPNPVLLLNVAVLTSFVLAGWGAFLLLRHMSGSALAGFVGGLMFAFAPYRFWQIDRLHALTLYWTPFLFLALHRYLEAEGRGGAVVLALVFALQALASIYVAYGTAVLLALFLLVWAVVGPAAERPRILRALVALAVGVAAAAVVYSPYVVVRDEMALGRDPGQMIVHAVVPAELGRMAASVPGYLAAKLSRGVKGAGILGVTATVLLAVAVVAGGAVARLYAALALAALVLSFGPVVVLPSAKLTWVPGPYRLLYDYVPGFSALREPRRFMGFVAAFGTLAAGLGGAVLLGRLGGRARWLGGAALATLVAFEVGWQPLRLDAAPDVARRRRLYARIAAGPPGDAVVELPIGSDSEQRVAMFRSTYHFRPLLNGSSGFNPTGAELRRRLRRFPSRKTVTWLRRLGVRFIVYDTQRPGSRSPRSLARRLGRTAPEARLTEHVEGAVLIEVEPLPPALGRAPAGELPRAGWRAGADSGEAAAALDGDLATHWTAPVDVDRGGGWFDVDFGRVVEFDLIRLELDAHYGEYPRRWRVLAREGERQWVVAAPRYPPAPLASYRADPHRVVFDLALPTTRARGIRIEVSALRLPGRKPPFEVPPEYWGWRRWGIHELHVYRAGSGVCGAAGLGGPELGRSPSPLPP